MSGLRRLSDVALAGAAAGAASGDVPVYNSATGKFAHGPTKFDARISAYNVTNSSLLKFRAAVAKARTGNSTCHIICWGDSITGGQTVTRNSQSYPYKLRSLFASRAGDTVAGTGILMANGPQPSDSRLTYTGPYAGGGWGFVFFDSAPTQTLTFTSDIAADTITLYYLKFSGGATFTVSVDSGSAVSVNSANATLQAAAYTVTGLASTTHTMTVTCGATLRTFLLGFESTKSTGGGFRVSNFGQSGQFIGNISTSSTPATSPVDPLAAFSVATPAAPAGMAGDLHVVMMESNDASVGTNLATYTSDMQGMISALKRSGDVVLMTTYPRSTTSPTVSAAFDAALYGLADANNIALIDIGLRAGGSNAVATANGLDSGDGTHPGIVGYQDIAAAVYGLIGESV